MGICKSGQFPRLSKKGRTEFKSDTTTGDGVCFVGDLVANVAGNEPGLKCNSIACLIEPTFDPLLAFDEPMSEDAVHLNPLVGDVLEADNSPNTSQHRRISSFFHFPLTLYPENLRFFKDQYNTSPGQMAYHFQRYLFEVKQWD